jgi:hypothetical protein
MWLERFQRRRLEDVFLALLLDSPLVEAVASSIVYVAIIHCMHLMY